MRVFIDTSALFAFLDKDDQDHSEVVKAWDELVESKSAFITTSYVLLETFILLQNRLGLAAARDFHQNIASLLEVEWVSCEIHDAAVTAVLSAGRKNLSIVDCVSFNIMRRLDLTRAFSLDAHFREQGFECVP